MFANAIAMKLEELQDEVEVTGEDYHKQFVPAEQA